MSDPVAKRRVGLKKPARTAIRVVRILCDLLDESGESYRSFAKRTGISYPSISKWKLGKAAPSVQEVENLLQVLGYGLQVVKLPDPPDPN